MVVSLAAWLLSCAAGVPVVQEALVGAGSYRLGSDSSERAWAYQNSPAAVQRRGWYDAWELEPHEKSLAGFWIDAFPVTQAQYAAFTLASGHRAPEISAEDYEEQGFTVHPYTTVVPYLWRDGTPPESLREHPVVLVSHADASAYCAWRGRRLPTEDEWEAACRGGEGRRLPWGESWQDAHAQHLASGTAPVGGHPLGATPSGVHDLIGNVFEWTGTFFDGKRPALRGCSWDDAPGTCRCAFRHGRPAESRHVLIGFRCARDAAEP